MSSTRLKFLALLTLLFGRMSSSRQHLGTFSTTIPEKQMEKAITKTTIPEKQMDKVIITNTTIPEKKTEKAITNIKILGKIIEKAVVSNITIPVKQMENATTNATKTILKSQDTLNLGRPRFRPKTIIVHGRRAEESEIPYIVTIKERVHVTEDTEIYTWRNFCGGNIIGPSRVLTAAHCFDEHNFTTVKRENVFMVVAGETQRVSQHSPDSSTDQTSQWRPIEDVKVHGNYSFPFFDVALVIVEELFSFNGIVSYVKIAHRTMDYPTSCKMAGFGPLQDRRGFDSPVLMVGQITPISRSECSMLWGRDMRMFVCTFTTISNGTLGDSGGPLVCQHTLDPSERPERDLLVGIIVGKNNDKTEMFTRVSMFANWIDRGGSPKLRSCVFIVVLPLILQ